jgi:hypothetical protein
VGGSSARKVVPRADNTPHDHTRRQVVVRKNPDATTDEERSRLETVGRFHTGVFINRITQGSLVRGCGVWWLGVRGVTAQGCHARSPLV